MSYTKLKPLVLLDIFKRLTDEEHRLNVPELVEELSRRGVTAERKGVYRDIAALCEFGADIRKSGTGYYLAKREINWKELRAIAAALQAAAFISQQRTGELIEKLSCFASEHQCKRLTGTLTAQKCETNEQLDNLEKVETAIAQRRQLTFAAGGRGTRGDSAPRRRISPYSVKCDGGRCYVLCNEEGREGISRLRLDKMQAVRSDMTPWRHFSEVAGGKTEFSDALTGGNRVRIRLRCTAAAIEEAMERFPSATVYKDSPDGYILTAETAPNEEFLRWISCMGSGVELLLPEELRCKVEDRLRAAIELYN